MATLLNDRVFPSAPDMIGGTTEISAAKEAARPRTVACHHCGSPCRGHYQGEGGKRFCCLGCLTVYELLVEHGLSRFYGLSQQPGVRVKNPDDRADFSYLDAPSLLERLLDFSDGRIARVTFQIPSIHCVACVWLLENIYRLHPGIGKSVVSFPRKEVFITFEIEKISLGELVELLTSLGYEPSLRLEKLEGHKDRASGRRLILQLGIAGFAFGNIMLFSLPAYFGLNQVYEGPFKSLFGFLSLALAVPVLVYSAADYWRSALLCFRQKVITIDVPIALGIAALFSQSVFDLVSGRGEGYLDSFAGLVFFLLCGKVFQRKVYDRLSFDRDYRSFFPLSVTRKRQDSEKPIPLSDLQVGDRIIVRHGELVPADSRVIHGPALIDYSFVTGESDPAEKQASDYVYAGGRQVGGTVELETVKKVSQSYLTTLWNHEAFQKPNRDSLNSLTNRVSRIFTLAVVAVAVSAGFYWLLHDSSVAISSFTAVLIVACPCALALSAPFAFGSALRVLARNQIFLKDAGVVEALSKIHAIIFDKTGTLTEAGAGDVRFQGPPLVNPLRTALYAMARRSTHPLCLRISESLADSPDLEEVRLFKETAGRGMEGCVGGRNILMGSEQWLASKEISIPESEGNVGSCIHVAVGHSYLGYFSFSHVYRSASRTLIQRLAKRYKLAILTGDTDKEKDILCSLLGKDGAIAFQQSPYDKLKRIQDLQRSGLEVLMIGDGLNDSGALKQSDVGLAVSENVASFSPASDGIISAGRFCQIADLLRYSKATIAVIGVCFGVSILYNIIGISFAASGALSPLVSAILMPLSSVTVVALATGMTTWLGKRAGFSVAGTGVDRIDTVNSAPVRRVR